MTWTNRISVTKGILYAGIVLSGTYILCNLLDLLFPNVGMKVTWETFLPRLTSRMPGTFINGLVESFLIGALFMMIIAPAYNLYFVLRDRVEEFQARRYNDRLKYY